MESYSVRAVLSAVDQNFTSSMRNAGNSLNNIDNASQRANTSMLKIAAGIGIFKALNIAIGTITGSLDGAIRRFDIMNNFPKVMSQIGINADVSKVAITKLSDGIQGLPTTLDAVVSTTQKLTLLTGSITIATDTTLALNNAFMASGATVADAERGLVQYTQMLSKGSVDIMSWRTLQETMGVALTEVAKSFGYAGESAQNDFYKALQDGTVTFSELNSKLIELDGGMNGFAERARIVSGGIGTAFANIRTAVVKGLEGTIRQIDEGLSAIGLPKLEQLLLNAKNSISTAFSSMNSLIVPAMKGIVTVFNETKGVLATVTAGFIAYKAAINISSLLNKFKASKEAAARAVELFTSRQLLSERALKASGLATKYNYLADEAAATAVRARTVADQGALAARQARAAGDANADKLATIAAHQKTNADVAAVRARELRTRADSLGTTATNLNTQSQIANTGSLTTGNIALVTKTNLMALMTGKIGLATAAQNIWNAAMAANPIGATVVAITAFIAVIVGLAVILNKVAASKDSLNSRQKELRKSTKELNKEIKESKVAYEENISKAKASTESIEELSNKLTTLASNENRTAEETETLKAYVDILNMSVDDLGLSYDELTGKLNKSNEEINASVTAYKKQAEGQVYMERFTEILKEKLAVEKKLAEATELRDEAEKMTGATYEQNRGTIRQTTKSIEEYEEKLKSLEAEEKSLTDVVVEAQNEQTRATEAAQAAQTRAIEEAKNAQSMALAQAIEDGTASMDMFSESQQGMIEGLTGKYDSLVEAATNMFGKLSTESELSITDMTNNLLENQRIVSEWADNLVLLADKGIDQGLLEKLREAGPESAGYVKAIASGSEEQIAALSDAFRNGGVTAKEGLTKELSTAGIEVDQGIMDMVTKGKTTLQEQWNAAKFSEIGKEVGEGLGQGIEESKGKVTSSAEDLAQNGVINPTKGKLGVQSPSTVFRQIGVDTIEGYIQGIESSSGALSAAMQSVMTEATNSAIEAYQTSMTSIESASTVSFTGLTQTAKTSMTQMTTVIKTSMTQMTTAIKTGMTQITTVIKTGMTSNTTTTQMGMQLMNNAVTTNMNTIRSSATAGMNAFSSAIKSGVDTARSNLVSGLNSMSAAITSIGSSFYSSGYNASMGLANGISAGAGAAIAAAQNLANSVAATIQNAMQVHSPSKLTMAIGEDVTKGFIIGLSKDLNAVKSVSNKIAEAATPKGNILSNFIRVGDYKANTNINSDYSYTANNVYSFAIDTNIDGRTAAKAFVSFTQEELDKLALRSDRKAGRI